MTTGAKTGPAGTDRKRCNGRTDEGGEASDVAALDPVTGTRSRASLQAYLQRELIRSDDPCAVFLFDVDFFKTVNDVYGHLRGDRVLRQLADFVKATARRQDVLFRYGGDEFVLVLPDTGRTEAIRLALRLTERIRAAEFAGEPPLHLTVSLGVAVFPEDGQTPTALLDCADRRNYLAKRRGRGGAVADDADIAEDDGSRLWERDGALSGVHEFLTRLQVLRYGRLRVLGQPGAGHSRFLIEVGRLAALRGMTVLSVPPDPGPSSPPPPAGDAGVLVVADVDAMPRTVSLIERWCAAGPLPEILGLVYASTGGEAEPTPPLAELACVELSPWSPSALRIWLRTTLRGEPSRTLVNWFARQTGGLPAAAARELERLRARRGLVTDGADGWTIRPELLGRPHRRVRLPAPLTPLVGRETETRRVIGLLSNARLVSLVGAGGIGKTRLALSVARAAVDDFADGAIFVPLAPVRHADGVLEAIATALGVTDEPGRPLLETLSEHLADAVLLLLLDNFEQVLDAGPAVGSLLSAAPGVAALVTSREPLGIYGEQVYRVPPLPLPDLDLRPDTTAAVASVLARSPAVALFDQRARAANAEFALDPDSWAAVAELCHRLDGLPLAIELAAARADRLSPQEVLAGLDPHLVILGEGPRDRPPRQRTLRGTVAWSYGLLDPTEQRVFTAVSLFAGGATVESVLAVVEGIGPGMAPPDPDDARRGKELAGVLDALVNKSLLVAETQPDGERRYLMLNTIHACAMELLAEPDSKPLYHRHLTYFAGFAERAGAGMTGPDQARWADALGQEYANLRAALAYAVSSGDLTTAARLCLGLWRHWRNGSHIRDGREWLARVLAAPDGLSATERVGLLYPAAVLAASQDDTAAAQRLGTECLELAEWTGDREGVAQARNILGVAAMLAGNYDAAASHFQYCLRLWGELDRKPGMAIALGNLANVALRQGDVSAADKYVNRCLELEREAGNRRGVLLGLTYLAEVLLARPDPAAVRSVAREALDLAGELGDLFGEALALHRLGQAALLLGERDEALRYFLEALERRHELGDRADLATSLDSVAGVVVDDDPELAVRLAAAVDTLRRRHGLAVPSAAATIRAQTLATARRVLDEASFTAAWRSGAAMPLELAVDQALDRAPGVVGRHR